MNVFILSIFIMEVIPTIASNSSSNNSSNKNNNNNITMVAPAVAAVVPNMQTLMAQAVTQMDEGALGCGFHWPSHQLAQSTSWPRRGVGRVLFGSLSLTFLSISCLRL